MGQGGSYPKKLPARLILVKKPSPRDHHGWKPKASVVCCGNFEEGTVGGDWKDRAEVPGSMEFRTLLAIASKKQWSIGGLDVKTAFLYAPLGPEEYGVILVQLPALL
eukprot:2335470-Prorocentrum_lima.AAC.1